MLFVDNKLATHFLKPYGKEMFELQRRTYRQANKILFDKMQVCLR